MRFVISGEWNRNQLLKLILFFFLVYMLLFWVTNWILYFQKMSLDPQSVVTYFRGDPDAEFGRPPRPLGSLAEVSHFHLFAMGMLVMTLTHLLLFLPVFVQRPDLNFGFLVIQPVNQELFAFITAYDVYFFRNY